MLPMFSEHSSGENVRAAAVRCSSVMPWPAPVVMLITASVAVVDLRQELREHRRVVARPAGLRVARVQVQRSPRPASAASIALSAICAGVIGRCGVIDGTWIAPVIAPLTITRFRCADTGRRITGCRRRPDRPSARARFTELKQRRRHTDSQRMGHPGRRRSTARQQTRHPAQRPTARLFAKYAVICLVPVLILGAVLAASLAGEARARGLSEGRREALLVAQTAVQPLLDAGPITPSLSADERAGLRRLVAAAVRNKKILRLRVRDLAGRSSSPTTARAFAANRRTRR